MLKIEVLMSLTVNCNGKLHFCAVARYESSAYKSKFDFSALIISLK